MYSSKIKSQKFCCIFPFPEGGRGGGGGGKMGISKRQSMIVLGLVITALFLGLIFFPVPFLDTLELKLYDVMMRFRGSPEDPSEVVIVEINDASVKELGGWPLSRSLIAEGIEKISANGPKVIGLNFLLSEPSESAGLVELQTLEALFSKTVLDPSNDRGLRFLKAIQDARTRLETDQKLADAIKAAGTVILPASFGSSSKQGKGLKPPESLINLSIKNVTNPTGSLLPIANEVILPIPLLLNAARGAGHTNPAYDDDGKIRREQLLYDYQGIYIPSYTLILSALYLNVPRNQIRADLGSAVYLGNLKIPTTSQTELRVDLKGPAASFKHYAFVDVVKDRVPSKAFKNKLVLIGPSAAGIMNPVRTPFNPAMTAEAFSARTTSTILNKKFIQKPTWVFNAKFAIIIALGLIVAFVLPGLSALTAGVVFLLLLILLVGSSTYFFVSKGLWVQVAYPLLQLVLSYIGLVCLKPYAPAARKEKLDKKPSETDLTLGLSYQSQGMLDMAFDKFSQMPVDEDMKGVLYNLALEYERKSQFDKAAGIYEYIEEHDSGYKDVRDKKKKLMQTSGTMVFGEDYASDAPAAPADEADESRPATDVLFTLGRYEVIKELGRGAMGTVYLGKDPRINRTTAIKTFQFEEEFEPEEIEGMKETFFREAESAGTLSHPNIVTIYDAGDQENTAYIAMEYLEGESLENYTEEDNLLPMRKVIDYVADIADGLDYAHQKGIVHRDIKPANIMHLSSGSVKITDFGIARIAATSKTQAGVVKGTPYYMSPEQFSGKKVDGRSDIFSLGTTMFQLLTGELPFSGDNPVVLMNQIMKESHPDPKEINPRIVRPLVTIINKALEKNLEERYQKASQMAAHLRGVGKRIDEVVIKKKEEKK